MEAPRCEACQRGKCHLGLEFDALPRRRYHFENSDLERADCKRRIPWLLRIDLNQAADPRKFRCATCNIETQGGREFQGHLSGQKHQKKASRVLEPSPGNREESDESDIDENDSQTDEDDVEAFHSADEESDDSGPEQPSSYQCSKCPEGAEVWGSKKALKHHVALAHRK